ncbi:MAG: zinc-ribbon domain-containing protein [Chloroflexi bacterium]|nr:zinc-ribbon domain-containing protein [Chloroflexota bacterium]
MPVWLWLLVWILIFAALAAVYVLQPVWRHQGREVSEIERQRSELLARRETVLTALRELDLDYAVGKLPADEYQAQRAVLLREGAQILRALDEVEQRLGAAAEEPPSDMDARLEALLEERRRERARVALTEQGRVLTPAEADASAESVDDMVESLLLSRRRERRARFAGFCPHCGAPYQENDRFCGKCGQPLHEPAASRKRRAKAKKR